MATTATTTAAAAAVQIKVRHGDDVRRYALELEKFSKLEKRVLRCYGLEAAPRGSHVIKYTDDEGDACSITNDDELAVALKGVADDQARGLTGVLRLALVATAGTLADWHAPRLGGGLPRAPRLPAARRSEQRWSMMRVQGPIKFAPICTPCTTR